MAGSKRDLQAAMRQIRDKGAVIVEARTGRRSDNPDDLAEMIFEAMQRKGHSSEDAAKYGAMAGHKTKLKLPEPEARALWHDARIATNAEAARRIGWTPQRCHKNGARAVERPDVRNNGSVSV